MYARVWAGNETNESCDSLSLSVFVCWSFFCTSLREGGAHWTLGRGLRAGNDTLRALLIAMHAIFRPYISQRDVWLRKISANSWSFAFEYAKHMHTHKDNTHIRRVHAVGYTEMYTLVYTYIHSYINRTWASRTDSLQHLHERQTVGDQGGKSWNRTQRSFQAGIVLGMKLQSSPFLFTRANTYFWFTQRLSGLHRPWYQTKKKSSCFPPLHVHAIGSETALKLATSLLPCQNHLSIHAYVHIYMFVSHPPTSCIKNSSRRDVV